MVGTLAAIRDTSVIRIGSLRDIIYHVTEHEPCDTRYLVSRLSICDPLVDALQPFIYIFEQYINNRML